MLSVILSFNTHTGKVHRLSCQQSCPSILFPFSKEQCTKHYSCSSSFNGLFVDVELLKYLSCHSLHCWQKQLGQCSLFQNLINYRRPRQFGSYDLSISHGLLQAKINKTNLVQPSFATGITNFTFQSILVIKDSWNGSLVFKQPVYPKELFICLQLVSYPSPLWSLLW